jgi:hypothetical protein
VSIDSWLLSYCQIADSRFELVGFWKRALAWYQHPTTRSSSSALVRSGWRTDEPEKRCTGPGIPAFSAFRATE